jgi:hypothetical protein
MNKLFTLLIFSFFVVHTSQSQTNVDCGAGPITESYCYGDNEDGTTFEYVSSNGSALNLVFNAGFLESCCDTVTVLDSDGSVLYSDGGDVPTQVFQSSGDSISIVIDSDFSVNCQASGYDPIDYNVSCATCLFPDAEYNVVDDCENGPQFFVEADITDLGSADNLDITDNQGSPAQTATALGVVSFGPYPNGTPVELTITNNQDENCTINSPELTQEFCVNTNVDCEAGPITESYCYEDNEDGTTFQYSSLDGSALNLVFNAGFLESCCDTVTVLDSDGSVLYSDGGDVPTQVFQSSGDNISIVIDSDFSVNCQGSGYDPINYTISCATCTFPEVNFEFVDDCLNGPQFFVEADVVDLGSAEDLDITDNQGNPAQTVATTGVVSFGPYPNGTVVSLTAVNNQDPNCQIQSDDFTQEFCTTNLVDCSVGPVNSVFCYDTGVLEELTYVSSDGTPLNLVVNSGDVENTWDEFIVLDTNGTELYNGYGNGGDLSGLSFQSTGDTITVQVDSDFIISCQSSDAIDPIDLTVSCATCINPQVDYEVVSNCEDGNEGFFVEVDILDLGDAPSLDVTNNQGDPLENVTVPTTLTFGPYDLGTDVVFTVQNVEDVNCTLTSPSLTLEACPPQNNTCDQAQVAVINPENFCETLNQGTLNQAIGSSVPVSCGGPVAQDVWFEFEATATTITSTIIFDGFGFPSQAIYSDDCGNLTELYCSEEFDNFGDSPAIVAENLVIGETYKIRVFSDTVTNQDFQLCLTTPQFNEDNTACDIASAFCAPFDAEGNALPLIFPNGYFYLTESVAEPGPDYGCLGSEPNPAWFFIQVDETGDLAFNITQNSAFNGNGLPIGDELDVDFIAYGPFTEQEGNCDQLTAANTVDCSYSAAAVEEFTIPNAEAGEFYILLITNFNQSPGYISLTQTNFGEPGSGTTNCDIVFQNQIAGCSGDEIILTATVTEAIFYQWYIFNEVTEEYDIIAGANDPTLEVDTSGLYQVLATQGTENIEEEFDVNISPVPEIELPDTISLCGVPDVTLDATVLNSEEYDNITYQWLLNGEQITGATNGTLQASEIGNYTVIITTTLTGVVGGEVNCETDFSVEVVATNFTLTLGDNQTFCEAEPQTITANVEGADTTDAIYQWNTGDETPSIEVNTSGTYEVTVEIDGCATTESVIYTFAEEPLFDLGEDLSFCDPEIESIILDATVSNASDFTGVSYQWSVDGESLAGETNPTLEVTTAGNYTVEVVTTTTTSDGEEFDCSDSDSVIVNFTNFSVDLGADQIFCDAEPQTLTAVVEEVDDANATYLWSTGETTESITVDQTDTYEVTVTINGCTATDSILYVFNESPILALGPDSETCDLTEFTLDATPSNYEGGEINYTWTLDNVLLDENGAIINPNDYGFGTYQVTVFFDTQSCSAEDEITLSLRDDISVSITSDDIDNLFCVEELVTFNASLQNAEIAEADFQWFVNDQEVGDNSPTLENYQITSTETNQVARVEVSIGTDCFVSSELPFSLYDLDNCVISQGLSPDTTPGFNDNLDLRFLDDRSGITSLEIFNRYGQRVYEKANYRDEFFGQSDNGNILESGTYFYVIKFDNPDEVYGQVHKGWIYINREQ